MDYSVQTVSKPVRDFLLALGTVVVLYTIGFSSVWPLQLPGYLLVSGFDRLEVAFGAALGLGVAYDVAFALYLLVLAALGAVVAAVIRVSLGGDSVTDGVAGLSVLLGVLTLLVAAMTVLDGVSVVPTVIVAVTGLVLVGLGWATALVARNYRLQILAAKES